MTTRHAAEEMQRVLKTGPNVFPLEDEETAKEPQSNCILDPSKLLNTGVKLRPLAEALEDCLDRLRVTSRAAAFDSVTRRPSAALV
jgi:hypothetical protein